MPLLSACARREMPDAIPPESDRGGHRVRAEPRARDSAIADSRARAFYRGVGPAASGVTASAYRCKHKNRVAAIVGAVDHVLPLPGTAFWRRTPPRALHSVARRVRRLHTSARGTGPFPLGCRSARRWCYRVHGPCRDGVRVWSAAVCVCEASHQDWTYTTAFKGRVLRSSSV